MHFLEFIIIECNKTLSSQISIKFIKTESTPNLIQLLYSAVVFYVIYNFILMISKKALLLTLLLVGFVVAQQDCVQTDPHLLTYMRNGLTFQIQKTPTIQNNWAGKFSCQGCNPAQGDVPCTTSLPLLCILHAKALLRPYYSYNPLSGPYQNPDTGYYNGWTGGVFQTTEPVRGYDITSYDSGDKLCKNYFGVDAKWAQFHDGYYQPNMNAAPQKTWKWWDWSTASCGAWGFWGYVNTNYKGRAWVWINNQATGNCADL